MLTRGLKITITVLPIILVVGSYTFTSERIVISPESPGVFAERSSWWGIKKVNIEIRWLKPQGYDFEAWCARDSKGNWYPYIIEDLHSAD